MNRKTKEFRKKITNYFIDSLKKDGLKWKKNWIDVSNPINAVTNKEYHGINQFWLTINGSKDNRWATLKQIQEKGWRLNKDAKGVEIEYWFPYDLEQKKNISWEEYQELSKLENNTVKLIPKYYMVFNGKDISGIPPIKENNSKVEYEEIVKKISDSMGITIKAESTGQSYYKRTTDTIYTPAPECFLSNYDYNSTILHELAHATGAEKRLHRDQQGEPGSSEYAYEELVAEISSVFMTEHLNLTPTEEHLKNHAAYVQSWVKELEKEPEILVKAIRDAEKTASYLEYHAGLITEQEFKKCEKSSISISTKKMEKKLKNLSSIPMELKKNGYKPNKNVVNNINKLNAITGKEHSLKDIQSALSHKEYANNSEADKLVKKIGKTLRQQELFQKILVR